MPDDRPEIISFTENTQQQEACCANVPARKEAGSASSGAPMARRRFQAAKSLDHKHRLEQLGAQLDPALLEWADKVIIPALARAYLTERNTKRIADATSPVSEFTANVEPSARVTP
jgi:hypothetical protein